MCDVLKKSLAILLGLIFLLPSVQWALESK